MVHENNAHKVIPFFLTQSEELSLEPDRIAASEGIYLEKERLMMAILDSINDGVFTIDFNMRITSFNRAAERITGHSAKEAIGKLCMDIFCNARGMNKDCIADCPIKKSMKHKAPVSRKRQIRNRNGEILTVSSTTTILVDLQGQPIGGVSVFADVTAFEQLKEKWQGRKFGLGDVVGKSPRMAEVYDLIVSISDSIANVLILGETGTGKGLIARAVHFHSIKHAGPFVQINCAAIPETLIESELFGHVKGAFTGAISDRQGRFEQAHKGTIFLDEIAELSPAIQAKLLRVVEEKQFERVGGSRTIKVDVRIIAATNRDLKNAVAEGMFREDLYFRLNTIPITLPPLRDRTEDIPLLVEHFIQKFNYEMNKKIRGAAPEVFSLFLRYPWPGNVRELESALEYSFAICKEDYLEMACVPPYLNAFARQASEVPFSPEVQVETEQGLEEKRSQAHPSDAMQSELDRLLQALNKSRWNRMEAAKRLNMSRTTLWRTMKKYNLL